MIFRRFVLTAFVLATGTLRVSERQRGWIELALDLIFTDDSGKTTAVSGRAQVTSER